MAYEIFSLSNQHFHSLRPLDASIINSVIQSLQEFCHQMSLNNATILVTIILTWKAV